MPDTPDCVADDVRRALAEDVGAGDLTASLIPAERRMAATVVSRETGVLCGRDWFGETFRQLDDTIRIQWFAADGDPLVADQRVCRLEGPARGLLSGERTALNFLQTLSGTATATASCVAELADSATELLDTRKTIPGLRAAQKYAVLCGGGRNHRQGLHDAILIKENHIHACGSITAAVTEARGRHPGISVEVEAETIDELREAMDAGADIIMLDEFSPDALVQAREIAAGRVRLEVSGNVDREGLRAIAAIGVDFVSVGAITKHLRALDLSMRFDDTVGN